MTLMATPTIHRRINRRGASFATVLIAITSAAFACGGSEPSAEQAREILMKQLRDSGVARDVAMCISDESLERFEPGELVNSSGEATPEINAAVAQIVAECTASDTTVPSATVPETTLPETTEPATTAPEATVPVTTVPDIDLETFCGSSEDVFVALRAADLFDEPTPATMQAYFSELIDRIELAIITAPNSDFATQPNELLDAVEAFDELLAGVDYDSAQVDEDPLPAESEIVETTTDELEAFLNDNCDTGSDIDAETSELADELIALAGDITPGEDGIRSAESVDLFISSDVPATWTSEAGETVDDRRVFIVATDAEAFKTSWGIDGVRFTGMDTTSDFLTLMDDTDAFRECTLLAEEAYGDGVYTGTLRRYEGCGEGTEAVIIGANLVDGEGTVLVEVQMVEFDPAVLETITTSFVV